MTVLAVIFSYLYVPEVRLHRAFFLHKRYANGRCQTANKTLEEIDYIFCKDGKPPYTGDIDGTLEPTSLAEKGGSKGQEVELVQ